MPRRPPIADLLARVERGGPVRYHAKNAEQHKLFARDRIAQLLDSGTFCEDGELANATDPELPADGVITGTGTIAGRTVALMANDSTVKAGSWGRRTVKKSYACKKRLSAFESRCSTSWIVRAPASQTKSRCFQGGEAPDESSSIRFV